MTLHIAGATAITVRDAALFFLYRDLNIDIFFDLIFSNINLEIIFNFIFSNLYVIFLQHRLVLVRESVFLSVDPCHAILAVPLINGVQLSLWKVAQVSGARGVEPRPVRALLISVALHEQFACHRAFAPTVNGRIFL